jgi:DNA polymerase-4
VKEFYPKNGRVILHVDMNSFYASVEMAYDPSLKGKPLAIAGDPKQRKGIVVTCSYEARKFGVKTTMPIWEAKKLCPELIVKPPNFDRYRAVSKAMFDILRQYTHLVEPVSIDEGYMDITESYEWGTPIEIAEAIQKRLQNELDLPSSIGIAPNKFLAKMASNMKKPMGITVLRKREVPSRLWPLPVEKMHGVGEKTAAKLRTIGIHTIGDLAKSNDIQLKTLLGIIGVRLKERANGRDDRKVDPESVNERKSIGNSMTLPTDVENEEELSEVIHKLAEKVSSRLKERGLVTTHLSVMIRFQNRHTITRSKKLDSPTDSVEDIQRVSRTLVLEHWNGIPVRLLGITAQDLVEKEEAYKQLDLFTYQKEAEIEPLLETLENLREKFGNQIIQKGFPRP